MGKTLGSFEEIVLLALVGLGDEAYGITIRDRVEQLARTAASIGAIYATLDRLEEKGMVRSWLGEATPERGGRAKRHFKIEGAGMVALQEAEEARLRLRQGVRALNPA